MENPIRMDDLDVPLFQEPLQIYHRTPGLVNELFIQWGPQNGWYFSYWVGLVAIHDDYRL